VFVSDGEEGFSFADASGVPVGDVVGVFFVVASEVPVGDAGREGFAWASAAHALVDITNTSANNILKIFLDILFPPNNSLIKG
jgi:hypothetical protein